MPGNDLDNAGAITRVLMTTLDQLYAAVTARLVNPDGSPSNTAIYMQLPQGQPIDPKMYANPWTPAGGSAYAGVSNDGRFASPTTSTPAASTGPAAAPAAQVAALPTTDPTLQLAISSAFNTSQRVDNMLMIAKNGVAVAWPQRTVSIEYFTALTGMQAMPIPEPSDEIKNRIADAEKALYVLDAQGNYTGYTQRHASYRHNQKALADARSAFALAYAQAMADPVAGQAWPVTSSRYQIDVDQAYNDWRDMGGQQIEESAAVNRHGLGTAHRVRRMHCQRLFLPRKITVAGSESGPA